MSFFYDSSIRPGYGGNDGMDDDDDDPIIPEEYAAGKESSWSTTSSSPSNGMLLTKNNPKKLIHTSQQHHSIPSTQYQQQQQLQQQQQQQLQSSSSLTRLAFYALAICICYMYYGILQEQLFTTASHTSRVGATFILMTQCITNTVVAYLWLQIDSASSTSSSSTTRTTSSSSTTTTTNGHHHQQHKNDHHPYLTSSVYETSNGGASNSSSNNNNRPSPVPIILPLRHTLLFITSGCYVIAMTCSNEAVKYVSYPVAVLAKSGKLIPTMLVGQLVEGRYYSHIEWLAAACISTGIILFHVSRMKSSTLISSTSSDHGSSTRQLVGSHDSHTQQQQQNYGMILLLISLAMDGILASNQNFLKQNLISYRRPTATETMLFINFYANVFLIPYWIVCHYSTMSWYAFHSILISPDLMRAIILLNLTVAAGQVFIFLTIQSYSPVITTTITTTRKFLTILLSVWTFGHAFSYIQWTAVALVFTGLYLAILMLHGSPSSTSGSSKRASRTAMRSTKSKEI